MTLSTQGSILKSTYYIEWIKVDLLALFASREQRPFAYIVHCQMSRNASHFRTKAQQTDADIYTFLYTLYQNQRNKNSNMRLYVWIATSIIHFSYIYFFSYNLYTPQKKMSQCKKCGQPWQCPFMHHIIIFCEYFCILKMLQTNSIYALARLRKIYSSLKFQLHI